MDFAAWLTATGSFLRGAWTVISGCHTACCQQQTNNEENTTRGNGPAPQSGAAETVPLTSKTDDDTVEDVSPTPESEPSAETVTDQPSAKPSQPSQSDIKKPSVKPSIPSQSYVKQPSVKPSIPTQSYVKQPSPTPLPLQTQQNTQINNTNIPINVPTTPIQAIGSSIPNDITKNSKIENNTTITNSQPNTNNPVFTFNPINEFNPKFSNDPTYIYSTTETNTPETNTIFDIAQYKTQQKIGTREKNEESQSEPESEETSIEWVRTSVEKALSLRRRAIVGGYDTDGTELWVIKTTIESEIRPAKFCVEKNKAFVASLADDSEKEVKFFEVCCFPLGKKPKITWEKFGNGNVSENAVVGGETSDGKPLYIGRKIVGSSQCLGMIRPSDKCLYLSYEGKVHKFETYDVMCSL